MKHELQSIYMASQPNGEILCWLVDLSRIHSQARVLKTFITSTHGIKAFLVKVTTVTIKYPTNEVSSFVVLPPVIFSGVFKEHLVNELLNNLMGNYEKTIGASVKQLSLEGTKIIVFICLS